MVYRYDISKLRARIEAVNLDPSDTQGCMLNVLRGNFQQKLPSPHARTVRLFLASTFKDFELERNCLWQEIVPELQQHCLQYGAELLVIDPFQTHDPHMPQHMVPHLLDEIKECYEKSAGVFFLGLLGDSFGEPVPPVTIAVEEISHIRNSALDAGKDVRLLDEWYRLDSNAHPPVYSLLKSTPKKKLDDKTRLKLVEVVQKGAHQAFQERLINQVSQNQQERFYMSAMEHWLHWILKAKDTAQHALVVFRKFDTSKAKSKEEDSFRNSIASPKDDDPSGLAKSQERLADMKNKVSACMNSKNCLTLLVPTGDANDYVSWLETKEKDKYVASFSERVFNKLKDLISDGLHEYRRIDNQNKPDHIMNENFAFRQAYAEALTHINWATQKKSPNFIGHSDILTKVRNLFKDAQKHKGVFLTIQGDQCSGKTSLMIEIAYQARNWVRSGDKLVVVPRFAGLTPESVYALELLQSLSAQISLAFSSVQSTVPHRKEKPKLPIVASWFSDCLRLADSHCMLLILLDDVHLVKFGRCNFLTMVGEPIIPVGSLPANVMIIASCASQLLSSTLPSFIGKKEASETKTVLTLPALNTGELLEIVKVALSEKKRTITADQEACIRTRLRDCPTPFLSSIFGLEACKWSSTQHINNGNDWYSSGVKTLFSMVEQKLAMAENEHGFDIISCICRYVDSTPFGLTETELLDILSCNRQLMHNECTASVLQERVVRFPAHLWTVIRKTLAPLLELCCTAGCHTIRWSHGLISNVVRGRYLQNSVDIKHCHTDLSELFSDQWSDHDGLSLTPSILSRKQSLQQDRSVLDGEEEHNSTSKLINNGTADHKDHFGPPSSIKPTMLQAFPQPLVYPAAGSSGNEGHTFNLRRVTNLWFQLLHAGNVEDLKGLALCNFAYLDAVLQSCGLARLLSIFQDTLHQILHHDIETFFDQVLLPSLPSLFGDYDQFASEVICRLRYTRAQNSKFLNSMVEQAMAWVDNYNGRALLVPLTYWIRPPRRQLAMSFALKDGGLFSSTVVQPTLNHQHLLVSGLKQVARGQDDGPGAIHMYHVASSTLVRSFLGHTDRVTNLLMAGGGQMFISTSFDKTVRIWDLIQGQCIRSMAPHTGKICCAVLTQNEKLIVTGSGDSTAKVSELDTGRVLRTFPDHSGAVCALALTMHGEFLVTGSGDFVVRVWSMERDDAPAVRFGGLMAPVTCMSLTSNDSFLMVACEDETLRVFSLCSGTELHELQGHDAKVFALTSAGDDCQVFAGCADGKIYCYDLHTAEILEIFDSRPEANRALDTSRKKTKASNGSVTSLKVTSDNWFLMSSSESKVHVWNLEYHSTWLHNRPHTHRLSLTSTHSAAIAIDDEESMGTHVTAIAMSHDFRYSACGTKSGVVALWDLEVVQCVWTTVHDPPDGVTSLAFNRATTILFSGTEGGDICGWSMATGWLRRNYQGHKASIRGIEVQSDGSRVISFDADSAVHIWSVALPDDPDTDLFVSFQGPHDFLRLTTNDRDIVGKLSESSKELAIWSIVEDGLTQRAKLVHNQEVTCMTMSRNGRFVVTGSADESLKVWEAESGFLTQVLVGHEGSIFCCTVADDEKTVVSAAADRLVIVWELIRGTVVHTFYEHKKTAHSSCRITAVAVSSDGSVVLSADTSGWLYAWACELGNLLTAFNAHLPVLDLICSADGNRVILRLDKCPHLPVLCLHNSPAGLLLTGGHAAAPRRHSNLSTSSIGSERGSTLSAGSGHAPTQERSTLSMAAVEVVADTASGGPPARGAGSKNRLREPHTVFDRLERSRSRASLYGDVPTTTTKLVVVDAASKTNAQSRGKRHSVQEPRSGVCVIL